eukprot:TRINITY_DN2822_c0_g1_i1.p1 TRINITY_DN2822_c0_g1~~TRINITY_DN2822_c0_g1_i1.p1  ORF type:complete len:228 (+),score=89.16 TRINITY_DN2822_c0_g1_i1:55-738(+)
MHLPAATDDDCREHVSESLLKKTLQAADQQHAKYEYAFARLQSENSDFRDELHQTRKAANIALEEVRGLRSEIQRLNGVVQEKADKIADCQAAKEQSLRSKRKAEKRLQELELKVKEAAAQQSDLSAKIQRRDRQIARLTQEQQKDQKARAAERLLASKPVRAAPADGKRKRQQQQADLLSVRGADDDEDPFAMFQPRAGARSASRAEAAPQKRRRKDQMHIELAGE